MSSKRVLITEGGEGRSRAALAATRSLARAGYLPTVTVSGPLSIAASSRWVADVVRVPPVEDDEAGYIAAVGAELERREYLTTLAISDPALAALGLPGAMFTDKAATVELARAAGFDVPETTTFASRQDAYAHRHELPYPVVVKPVVKRYPAALVRSPGELYAALRDDGDVVVQPFLAGELTGVSGVSWKGSLVATVHTSYVRLWPFPVGTVASAVTIAADNDVEARLARLLADYDGIFHVEFVAGRLLDVNPRPHALNPLATAAGVDLVTTLCRLHEGAPPVPTTGAPGRRFRWIEGDYRSIVAGVRAGELGWREAVGAARPRHGTVHSTGSLDDPGPLLARLRYGWRRLRSASTRRSASSR